MNPSILRDSPDAKWRLLELVLQAEPHSGKPRDPWPEIIIVGDAFAPGTLAAARALASAFEIRIHFAESVGKTTRYHEAPDTSAMGHFFARGGTATRRTFFIKGQLRWSARARRAFAYVRQFGRFPGDIDFWQQRLSNGSAIRLSSGEHRLQFRLFNAEDFDRFEEAVHHLEVAEWTGSAAGPDEGPADETGTAT